MPELITSIVAAFKGQTDLAVGNVVGSSLLNQLLVLGSSAIVSGGKGLEVVDPLLIDRDLPVMVVTTLACMPIFWTKGRISRTEGGVLLGLYIFYIIDQVLPRTLPTWQDEFRLVIFCIILPVVITLMTFQTIIYWKHLQNNKKRSAS